MKIEKYKDKLGYQATINGVKYAGFTRMEAIERALFSIAEEQHKFREAQQKMFNTVFKLAKQSKEAVTPEEQEAIDNCYHSCTSNCRRVGCNCECGEYHIGK